ncbi:hypothetical protein LCGC14_0752500 [marine sediment metagenome]|uniref:Uncharacterized protein n=1 Tax=marine sediment metagenome TaxID=412755 RepID=A0A0F9Q3J8_9ZZZZ|nr:hypothetical protein [Candidatus Aminicenantes bacterium]
MSRKTVFIYVIEVKLPWKRTYQVPAGPQGIFCTDYKTALKELEEYRIDLDPEKDCPKSEYRIVIYAAVRDLYGILAKEAVK